MTTPVPGLLDKRLLIVSGKGGVGKTVVSSALGLIASGQGQNVLLVKMDDQGRTAQLFGAGPVTDRISPLRENVSAVNLDPRTVVADYFHRQLRVKRLVRHIMDSRLFQSWFRVSPAIKEMILLGKVWTLVDERTWWRKEPVWDLVIFDAPATGHGLGLLRLPEQASKLLIGPMRTNALGVQALLEDHAQTSLVLTTLPEEMPVNETIHFYEQARAHLDVHLACVVLNGAAPRRLNPADVPVVMPRDQDVRAGWEAALAGPAVDAALEALLPGLDPGLARAALLEAAQYGVQRRALTERYAEELRRRVELPLVEVPYVYTESLGYTELEQVADALAGALGVAPPPRAGGGV